MSLGLDPEEHLVMRWQWRPVSPPSIDTPLPPRCYEDPELFQALHPPETLRAAFCFSFPQLSRQTPDLRFYRLIQLFNTPLLSLSTRDAGRSAFALWHGKPSKILDEYPWAHLWFFEDARDGDQIAVEFGFDGGLRLWSRVKDDATLRETYREICGVNSIN